jgi:ribosomal protein S12 methylthiotransferase accessory factor
MNGITIRSVKKHFFDGTHRAITPEETYERIKPLMQEIGVAEVRDITHLDRLGIPVFSVCRPSAAVRSVQYYSGKGKEPLYAEISAMMEAIERFCGEYRGNFMEFTSYEEIGLTKAINPADLILPRGLQMGEKIHWTPSWDILNDEKIFIPSNAVFHPYNPLGMTEPLFRSDTTGLAGGNVLEEAILHGICEVIERDALSAAERNQSPGKRIIIESEEPVRDFLEIFEKNGVAIHLWLLEGKTRIPTVAAAADDVQTRDPSLLVTGSGTHTCPQVAVLQALTKVAQSRARYLQGRSTDTVREQFIRKAGYERLKRINKLWFADADEIDLEEIPDLSTDYIDRDIEISLNEIKGLADRVCVCDLSQTSVPVVRVIIPGFEVSYMDSSRRSP